MARLKGFKKLTIPSEALKKWLTILNPRKCEELEISVNEALNRVISSDIFAREDLPRFDKSAVDGYALLSTDTAGASQFEPIKFKLPGINTISYPQAFPIWTGNPIPKNTDTVVMIENTKKTKSHLEVYIQLPKGANVSKKGEDVKAGELAIRSGTLLKPQHLALISALGYESVNVSRKPMIGILATGDELVPLTESPSKGQIFESNRVMLAGLCKELGCKILDLGISKDDPKNISDKIRLALENCDCIITTGGTSVGKLDFVPEVINKIGTPGVIVHGIALRPGMPTGLAIVEKKPILILSGNPVAAMVGFEVFMKPLLFKMIGLNIDDRVIIKGTLIRKAATRLGRQTYLRVRVFKTNGQNFVEPISARGSSIISSLTKANGFVIVPANREGVRKGEIVSVLLFGPLESEKDV